MCKFNVGDLVKIRGWYDMASEFGVMNDVFDGCSINTHKTFVRAMRPICGSYAKITSISGKDCKLEFIQPSDNINYSWSYSTDMLESVVTDNEIIRQDCVDDSICEVFMQDSVWKTLQEKIALQNENAELKRLLGQALTDFEDVLSSGDACYFCSKCGHCTDCEPEWRYADEAEKVLNGGESNG